MSHQRLFIQIPVIKQNEDAVEVVGPIDYPRMDQKHVRLCEWQSAGGSGGGIGRRLVPVLNLPVLSDLHSSGMRTFDHAELAKEQEENLRSMLVGYGEAGDFLNQHLFAKLQFSEVFRLLNEGHFDEALHLLQQIYFDLMSGQSEVADRFVKLMDQASNVQVAFHAMRHSDVWRAEKYQEFGARIKELLDAFELVQVVFLEIDPVLPELTKIHTTRQEQLGMDNPVIANAVKFFRDDPREAFPIKLIRYDNKMLTRADMEVVIETANAHLAACHEAMRVFKARFESLVEQIKARVLPMENEAKAAADTYRQSRDRIFQLMSALGHDRFSDAMVAEIGLTPEQLKILKEVLENSPNWEPGKVKRELLDRFQTLRDISDALGQLTFPSDVDKVLRDAKKKVTEIEARWGRMPAKAPTFRPTSAASSSTTTPTNLDPVRIQALYEQLICVGIELTGDKHPMRASTIQSMLRVLIHLDRLTPEEFVSYLPAMRALSNQPGERFTVTVELGVTGGYKAVSVAWADTDQTATWLSFRNPKKLPVIKITHAAAIAAEQGDDDDNLFLKHHLTRELIRSAYATMKTEQAQT